MGIFGYAGSCAFSSFTAGGNKHENDQYQQSASSYHCPLLSMDFSSLALVRARPR
jgi:hypothetical protein